MQFQRASPNEVLVFAPVEEVREAAWHALWNERIVSPVIDVDKNLVAGLQGDGLLVSVRVATAQLVACPEGTRVSFESRPVVGGKDIGANGRAKKLANSLERILASGYSRLPQEGQNQVASVPAPIADPSGVSLPNVASYPVYGSISAPKRGVTLLCYGVLSVILCQILAPLTLIYGFSALNDYKRRGDPGDKRLIVVGMSFASVGCLFLLGLFVMIFL